MDYDKQVEDFLKFTGTTIEKKFVGFKKHFADDESKRNVWSITIRRPPMNAEWTFDFGDSINSTDKDVIQMCAKYSVGYEHLPIDAMLRISSVRESMKESGCGFSFVHRGDTIRFLKRKDARHQPPSDYDILACASSDSYCDYDDEYEFANEFGYEIHNWNDYKKVRDIYQGCKEAARMGQLLFGDVMDQLQEIQ